MGMATQLASCLAKMIWMALEVDMFFPLRPRRDANETID